MIKFGKSFTKFMVSITLFLLLRSKTLVSIVENILSLSRKSNKLQNVHTKGRGA